MAKPSSTTVCHRYGYGQTLTVIVFEAFNVIFGNRHSICRLSLDRYQQPIAAAFEDVGGIGRQITKKQTVDYESHHISQPQEKGGTFLNALLYALKP